MEAAVRLILAELQRLIDVDAPDDSAEYREAAKQHYRDDDVHFDVVAALALNDERGYLVVCVVHGAEKRNEDIACNAAKHESCCDRSHADKQLLIAKCCDYLLECHTHSA